MDQSDGQRAVRTAAVLVAIAIVVCALYFARDILIPLALAAFFAMLCGPMVRWVERLRVGRVASVFIVVASCAAVVGGVGWIVAAQAAQFVDEFPTYRTTILDKVRNMNALVPGPVRKASEAVEEINQEIRKATEAASTQPASAPATQPAETQSAWTAPPPVEETSGEADGNGGADGDDNPLKVQLVNETTPTLSDVMALAAPVVHPIIMTGITIVILIFFLTYQEDLRDRVICLFGRSNISVTTAALMESKKRVARYLQALALANLMNGIVTGVGLYFIGVPNAALWGLLSGLFRFVPFIGPWIATIFPVAVSAAISPGWTMPLVVIAWCVSMDLLSANFVEPVLYGGRVGAAAPAILISFIFWTWMWGAIGLFLATPIVVCLVTLGRHVPSLGILHTLLSDQPVFDARARYYQRILARDHVETAAIVRRHRETNTLVELCDDVLIPTLVQLQIDQQNGLLTTEEIEAHARLIEHSLGDPASDEDEQTNDHPLHAAGLRVHVYDGPFDALLARLIVLIVQESVDIAASPAPSSPDVIAAAIEPRPSRGFTDLCERVASSVGPQRVRVGLFAASRFGDVARRRLRQSGFGVHQSLKQLLPDRILHVAAPAPAEARAAVTV